MKGRDVMEVRLAKSIAEYAIRKWLAEQNFEMENFELTMNGNEAVLADENGDTLKLVYDHQRRVVYVKEEQEGKQECE